MPNEDGEILVRLQHDTSGRWQIVPLSVGPDIVIEMLPNPSSAQSSISRATRERLQTTPFLEWIAAGRYHLHELAVQGQRLSDLEVRVSAGPALLGLDGILGRNFFSRFGMITWEPHNAPEADVLRLYDP